VLDRIYHEENTSVLQAKNYDPKVVGAYLLGQDAWSMSSHPTSNYISKFFRNEMQLTLDLLIRESCLNQEIELETNEMLFLAYAEGYLATAP
jgi:predicted nucleotidyltransferase